VLLIRGAMGAPSNRKRSVIGVLAAAVALWLGGSWLGACDLNPQPLPPNGFGSEGSLDAATVGAGSGSGGGSSGSSSGGSSGGPFKTGADSGLTTGADSGALPVNSDADAVAPDAGGSDSGPASLDAGADASDGGDASDRGDASDPSDSGPADASFDGSGD
jgi:hypothetical protein